jgi:hypothetical protein
MSWLGFLLHLFAHWSDYIIDGRFQSTFRGNILREFTQGRQSTAVAAQVRRLRTATQAEAYRPL